MKPEDLEMIGQAGEDLAALMEQRDRLVHSLKEFMVATDENLDFDLHPDWVVAVRDRARYEIAAATE